MSGTVRKLTVTWVTMLALAIASVWLIDHRLGGRLSMTVVMAAAAAKAFLLLVRFMDIMHASRATQLGLFAWVGACFVLVIALH